MTGSKDAGPARVGSCWHQITGQHQLLTVTVDDRVPRARVVTLGGELDVQSAPRLERILVDLLSTAPQVVILDVSGLTFLAAAGTDVLVRAAYRAGDADIGFCLAGVSRSDARLLEVAETIELFERFDGVQQALRAVRRTLGDAASAPNGLPGGDRRRPRQLDHPSSRRIRRNQKLQGDL